MWDDGKYLLVIPGRPTLTLRLVWDVLVSPARIYRRPTSSAGFPLVPRELGSILNRQSDCSVSLLIIQVTSGHTFIGRLQGEGINCYTNGHWYTYVHLYQCPVAQRSNNPLKKKGTK